MTMPETGFPPQIVKLLRGLCGKHIAAVRTASGVVSDRIRVRKGVCQGCVISPCLFNIDFRAEDEQNAGWMDG